MNIYIEHHLRLGFYNKSTIQIYNSSNADADAHADDADADANADAEDVMDANDADLDDADGGVR